MARPSKRSERYEAAAESMGWRQLRELWTKIQSGSVDGWENGKAFEHLIVRGFRLSKLRAEYPFDVPPGGKPLEQIDGLVELDGITFLIECKDRDVVDIETIAKLRNQLLRRPETTMGCIFVDGEFTEPALTLADFSVPHRILLWPQDDIERCLREKDFQSTLRSKYNHLCKYGLTDLSPHFREFKAS